jgi:parallel beta-helix repeat protein
MQRKNTIENNITNSQVIRGGIRLANSARKQLVSNSTSADFIGISLSKGSTGNTLKNNDVSKNDTTSESMGILVRENSDGNTLEGITS